MTPPQADVELPSPQPVELRIPWITYVRLAAALLTAFAAYVLWPLLLLVFLALFRKSMSRKKTRSLAKKAERYEGTHLSAG